MIIKRKNICYLRVNALKAEKRNDNYQDYIQLYMVKLGCFNKNKNKSSFHWNQCKRDSRHNSMPNRTAHVIMSHIKMYA